VARFLRWRRWFRRAFLLALAIPAVYGVIVLIGLLPVNNGFESAEEGIEIRVISTAVHADLIVPLVSEEIEWLEHFPRELFAGDTGFATHVAIGWGDRGFYLETPTWADLTFSTAARALLWPTDSCLHVTLTRGEYWRDRGRVVRISRAQYREMAEFVLSQLKRGPRGEVLVVPEITYGEDDVFLEARGRYHALNTCNSWAGRAMRSAGIRVPWLTPLPRTMFLWLPGDA
jgi:uncharacterized protein (TIGR02117 family)